MEQTEIHASGGVETSRAGMDAKLDLERMET